MSVKKIVPCLDIRDGKVVKGTKFRDIKEIAPPLELAKKYNQQGADLLVLYDISASTENKTLTLDLIKQIKDAITIPLMVGGGINTLEHCSTMLDAGADLLSINTGAIRDPKLISNASKEFGSEKIVLSVDVNLVDGEYMLFTAGGRKQTDINATDFIIKAQSDGAGMVVINSIDSDGVQNGFNLKMLSYFKEHISIPIVASGGAGSMEDFYSLFSAGFDYGLAASIFHYDIVKIDQLKEYLKGKNINVKI